MIPTVQIDLIFINSHHKIDEYTCVVKGANDTGRAPEQKDPMETKHQETEGGNERNDPSKGATPRPSSPSEPSRRRIPTLAPQEVLLDAACAFDNLGRFATAGGQDRFSKAQADVVMHLALFGPTSMTELAECLAVSKEHVTRTVSALEEQGLLTKQRGAKNRRAVEAVLTEEGEHEATSLRLIGIGRLEALLSCLSPQERDELVDLSTRALALLLKIRLG